MGSRLGRRVIHFANLPLKLLLPPPPLSSVHEFAVKTIPSASKLDIRRCLESLYGFDVAEVRTLNMEGKKIKRGFLLAAKPDYKKAYITLNAPLSVGEDLFPIGVVKQEMERKQKAAAKEAAVVEEKKRQHWLDENKEEYSVAGFGKKDYGNKGKDLKKKSLTRGVGEGRNKEVEGKFPWSGMPLFTAKSKSAARKRSVALKRENRANLSWRSQKLPNEMESPKEEEEMAEETSGQSNHKQSRREGALRNLTLGAGKSGGRNSSGRITSFHRGGGTKRLQRKIDYKRSTSSTGIVERIEYDPNRSSRIALVRWTGGVVPRRQRNPRQ